jgi:peptide/nickel transport system substrate-binding protein
LAAQRPNEPEAAGSAPPTLEADEMSDTQSRRGTAFDPADAATAAQWEAWRASRRGLIKAGLVAGGIAAFGGAAFGAAPVARAAQNEPKPGGKLAMSLADDDVKSFDPIAVTDNMSIWTQLLIYDQLIRVGPDGKSLEPGLADKWDVSPDNLTYTFHLRDAQFHDGSPVTADDVVYSMNRAVNEKGSQWAFIFSAVDKMEATDPKTVTMHLKEPWAPFEADLGLFAASVIPKKLHEAQGDALWQKPVGSGPFVFDSWTKGAEVVLKKNPHYWVEGQPYLDELHFPVLTDSNARMLQFQGGDLDIATDAPFSQLDALKANPDVVVLQDAVARIDYVGINNTKAPFNDKKLRQAMNYAVNKDAIIQNVLFGAGTMANTYLPKMYGHDDSIAGYPYDLDKATALVAESAGKDGFSAELLISAGDPVGAQVGQLIAADLAQIGGKITITQVDPATNTDRVHGMKYDMSPTYYTTDIIDPDELTTFAVQSDGGTQAVWTGYKNEEVDKLVRQAQGELDKDKRLGIYKQIQQLVSDDAHILYLYYPTGRDVTSKVIQNFHVLPTGNYRLWETWRTDV